MSDTEYRVNRTTGKPTLCENESKVCITPAVNDTDKLENNKDFSIVTVRGLGYKAVTNNEKK